MDAAVLFSGGRDSALAALVLAPFYDVTLVTGHAGVTDDWTHARQAARSLGATVRAADDTGDDTDPVGHDPTDGTGGTAHDATDAPSTDHGESEAWPGSTPTFCRVELDREVVADAARQVRADGYPRDGIQRVHEHAVERVARLPVDAVADGTRRDDRTPRLDRSTAQSVEDRHGVDYLAPLSGVGHGAVRAMAQRRLRVTRGPSESVGRGDYEAELRALVREQGGSVGETFPAHEQSRVEGLRAVEE